MYEKKLGRRAYIAVIHPKAVAGIIELRVEEKQVFRGNVELTFNTLTAISTLNFIPVTTVCVGAGHCISGHSTGDLSDI